MEKWFDVIVHSTQAALAQLLIYVPKIAAALLLLLIAYVIAKIAQKIATRIAQAVGADRVAEKAGIESFLRTAGFRRALSWYVGRLLFWIILLLFLLPISDILSLGFFADVVGRIVYYLPNLLVALIILVIGFWAARVLGGLAEGAAVRIGAEYSRAVGAIVRGLIILVTLIITLSQLNIAADILVLVVVTLLASLGIAFALSMGLGSVEIVKNLLAGYYLQRQLKPGTSIQVGNIRGTLVAIGTLVSMVQSEEEGKNIILPNAQFVQQMKGSVQ